MEAVIPSGTLMSDFEDKVKQKGLFLHIKYKYPNIFFHDNFLPNVSHHKIKTSDIITREMEKEVRR